jgi:protein-disulfide isomerase-like protein with CxxC motif
MAVRLRRGRLSLSAAEARQIIADQYKLIVRLKSSGQPTLNAERALKTYVSAHNHLEDHERRVRTESKAKKQETKEPQ